LIDNEIAASCESTRLRLRTGSAIPEFRLRMYEHLAEARKAMLKYTLTERDKQLALCPASHAVGGLAGSPG
jgi:hypothetical protein